MKKFVLCLWTLSGLPVGLALIFLPPAFRWTCFVLFVLLETGHSLSPIVLAWTHRAFRQEVIYEQMGKYVLGPVCVFIVALGIGIITQLGVTSYRPGPGQFAHLTDWTNPFPAMVWFYSAWNVYHFAAQDFGVLMLVSGHHWRRVKKLVCLAGLPLIYFSMSGISILGFWHIPGLVQSAWLAPMLIGVWSVNHWVVDIGLSAYSRHSILFVIVILAAGLVGFVWIIPTSSGMLIRMIPAIISARLGLGFVHFLYSRWVWKLSDPRVAATIGRELFS